MSKKEIKCVIWDLDETMWNGVLLEEENVSLKENIKNILEEIDRRGILQSICSKNDYDVALERLQDFGIADYFLYPQISWEAKSVSIRRLQEALRIGMDGMMLIDDQPFERDEVQAAHPEIMCFDAQDYQQLLELACLQPKYITDEARMRRQMYQAAIQREKDEQHYAGTPESFLKLLGLKCVIAQAQEGDLSRVEELTIRTNQLNATGVTYSYEELDIFRQSDQHLLLVCELTDKYGSYGKIGIALVELQEICWRIRLLLISCRVISRGVGTILLSSIAQRCKREGKRLLADFRETGRNRMMFITYRLAGFKECSSQRENEAMTLLLESDLTNIQPFPAYIEVVEG